MTTLWSPVRAGMPSLAIHGGAGARPALLSPDEKLEYHDALRTSVEAGRTVLMSGGLALDAVCASVEVLENSPLFNAAHGAALNSSGMAELDAAVMTGSGEAGAVIASTIARNPVDAARAVMEQTPHIALVDPDAALLESWGIATAPREYFVTQHRLAQVERLQSEASTGPRHGTVGAVARDRDGHVAAATSTGGTANQMIGRVGDSPLIGAGTWASDDTVAISCTGHGEQYVRHVLAHRIHDSMALAGKDVRSAVSDAMELLGSTGGSGGLIAADSEGNVVLTYNSEGMFSGYLEDGEIRTHV